MSTVIESLYYQMYNSFLLNDMQNAKMYLDFIRDDFKTNEEKFEIFDDKKYHHLTQIAKSIDENIHIKSFESYEANTKYAIKEDEYQFIDQNEMLKEILLNINILRNILNEDDTFSLINSEQNTKYGRVDLLGESKKVIYPIELKKGIALQDVISQIDKYVLDFKMKLILKIYEEVKGVVIANAFSQFAIDELPKIGIIMIKYSFQNSTLKLTKL